MKKPAKNGASSPVAHAENSGNAVRKSRRAVRKQAQKRPNVLPNGMERLRATIEASVDCIITIDAHSTILEFNAAAERTFGYAREEVLGKLLTETIIPPSLRDAHLRGIAALLKGGGSKLLGRRVELPAMRADGSEFPVELTITRIASENPPLFTAYLRDITERKRADEELSHSLALLRTITEGTTDAVFAKDRQGRYIMANTATARFVGKSSEEVTGLDDTALFSAETAARIMERDRSVMESGETRTDEDVGTTAEGVFHVYLTTKGPLRDSSGAINGVFGIARDITERKRADEKLRDSESRFRELAENIDEVFWVWTVNLGSARLLYVSPAYATIWGRSCASLYASPQSWQEALHPEDKEGVLAAIAALDRESMSELTYRIVRPDKSIRWISDRIFPVRDERGVVVRFAGIARDITGSKITEIALRESEQRFRTIFEQAPLGISEGEIATARLISANQRYVDILGYSMDELRQMTFKDYTYPEDLQNDLVEFQRLAAGEIRTYAIEKRYIRKDGAIIWVNLTVSALPSLGEKPLTCIAVLDDITERKRAQEALNAQALRYRTLMETSTDSIYVLDGNGDLQEANTAFLRRRGYTAAEAKGLNVVDWDTQLGRDQLHERIRKLVESSEVFDTRHRCKDGSVFYVEVSVTAVRINGEQLFFCVARDITERKRAEERLREYERVVEGLEEMIVVVDRDYRYLLANRAFLNFRGLEREQLIGRRVPEVLGPEAFAGVAGKISECLAGKTIRYEMRYRFPDNRERDLLVSYLPIEGSGGIDRVACVLQDITERKQAEDRLRRSEEKFKTLFAIAPVGIAVLDRQRNILDANSALAQITRLSREELLRGGQLRRTILKADGTPMPPHEFPSARALRSNRPISNIETGIVLENGEAVWLQVSAAPLTLPDMSAVVVTQDITARKCAEEELKREKEVLAKIVNNIPVMIGFVGTDGSVSLVNPEWERSIGWTLEELREQNVDIFAEAYPDPSYRQKVLDLVAASTGEWADLKIKVRDGHVMDAACAVVHLSDGTKVAIAQDITERKRAEQALRETEQRFRELAENVNEVFWLSDDQNARMHYISPAYERVWGRSCESLYAAPKSWMDAVHPEDKEQVLAYVAKRSLNEAYDNTYRIVRPDGSIRWIHDRGFPVRDESGVAVRFAGIAEDVTSQKQAEEALRESEQQMRLFMEATADCLWKWDLITGNVVRSVGFHRLFGYDTEEVDSSITWWEERLHPDDRAKVLSTFQETMASGGNACSYEYRFRRKDGTLAVIQDHACIVRDARGRPLCALGAMTDITERRQAEDRLRRSEEKFKTLFAIAPVGIAFLDSRLNIVDCNPALERMSRLSRKDLLGQAWRRRTFLNADGSPRLPAERISERAVKAKLPVNGVETGAVMESGDIVWAEVSVAPLALPNARAVVIMQDITERKRTEQAQERGLSLMLATLESTADGILVVNTKGKIVTFNRLFARMWRLPDEVLASKEDARALECVLDQLAEPEGFLEKVSYLYCHPEEESFDQLVFKDGRVFERYSRPQLIGGKVAGRVWSFRDITERNQGREALQKANRQLRSLSRRLFQVQEQEKRHLARELHDEIGQALTAVKINLTSLGTANGDNSLRLEETIALLDNLLRQVRQISLDLHPSLLDDLGLAAALRSLLDQQARRAGLRAQFHAAQLTDNIDVAISSTAFRIAQEAITNVLRHAKASFIKVQLQTQAGRLQIEVADDGAGFDVAEARQRGHQEAGFGLMGMKERAALVGGDVEVTSAPGTGTRVQISLPLKENGSTP